MNGSYKGQPGRPMSDETFARTFWRRVEKGDACWIWRGATRTPSRGGGIYGRVMRYGRTRSAQVVAYELVVGPVPHGLVLDHLCRNTLCVRPDHLEPVTNIENIMRGDSKWAKQARQTHCINGHELTPGNLERCELPKRKCSTCKRERRLLRASLPQGLPASG